MFALARLREILESRLDAYRIERVHFASGRRVTNHRPSARACCASFDQLPQLQVREVILEAPDLAAPSDWEAILQRARQYDIVASFALADPRPRRRGGREVCIHIDGSVSALGPRAARPSAASSNNRSAIGGSIGGGN